MERRTQRRVVLRGIHEKALERIQGPQVGKVYEFPHILHLGERGNKPHICHDCNGKELRPDGTACLCVVI